jgi:hypothetical protein
MTLGAGAADNLSNEAHNERRLLAREKTQ